VAEVVDMPAKERGRTFGAWPFVLALFAGSRLFYLVAGVLLVGVMPTQPIYQRSADSPFGTMPIWSHYDGENYVTAALHGYLVGGDPAGASQAFFPFYPLLVRLTAGLLATPLRMDAVSVVAIGISLTALPFALWFIYRIAEELHGVPAARAATLALAFFPTAFFLNAAYTESLFLALSAGAVWAARVRRDLLLACLFAALATATRNVGVFLLIPLAAAWWHDRARLGARGVVCVALAPSGLAAYSLYLWLRSGDPLLFVHDQAEWGRSYGGEADSLGRAVTAAAMNVHTLVEPGAFQPFGLERLLLALSGTAYLLNLLCFVFAVALVAVAARRLPADLMLYAAALALIPAFFGSKNDPLMSLPRYLLVAFPLFVALGTLLKNRLLLTAWVAGSALLSLSLVALFVNWYYVS
jgi:hypothetical protein